MKTLYIATPILILFGLFISNFSPQLFGESYAAESSKLVPLYRNFLFIGIPYFCIGDLLRKRDFKFSTKLLAVLSMMFWIAGIWEMQLIKAFKLGSNGEYFLFTPFCAVFIFLFLNQFYQNRKLSFVENKAAFIGRKYVTWIYLINNVVIQLCNLMITKMFLPKLTKLVLPLLVYAISVLIAMLIEFAIERKK